MEQEHAFTLINKFPEIANSCEQRSPELVRIPPASRPEYFAFSGETSICIVNEDHMNENGYFYNKGESAKTTSKSEIFGRCDIGASNENMKSLNFNDMYVMSNSPMASNCNSDIENDTIEDEQDISFSPRKSRNRVVSVHRSFSENEPANKKYKKFTYEDIENSLSQYYDKNEHHFSDTDLLITYLSGMRTLYVISRNITQQKSYTVAIFTIALTICLAVISPFVKDVYWGSYLISSGNATATVLIVLSRYLKFDSNSAQYAFMAKQFNKLETRLEYTTIPNIESNIMEMNEYIQELIPEEAVKLFPLTYRTNIIQFIRKTELYKKNLIIRFRDIKNEIHYILYKWNLDGEEVNNIDTSYQSKTPQQEREKNRILYLMNLKEKTKTELMSYKTIYIQLNDLFKKEIRYAETHQSCLGCSSVFKPDYDFSKLNPVVREYVRLMTPD